MLKHYYSFKCSVCREAQFRHRNSKLCLNCRGALKRFKVASLSDLSAWLSKEEPTQAEARK